MGDDPGQPDPAARALVRRLAHYRRSATGQLAFGTGSPLSLDADFIVFWAPNLALPDREMLASEHRSRMMLPEQVLGQALLYLVAAVGRRVVFDDPRRFAAALYDEAWALLASPYGQNLLIEGVRDGRKHNGAIWLASQHPNDFAVSELADLLGSRFVFRQARQAIPAALAFLGASESVDAAATLDHGLGNGQCLYRDVRERIGLIQVLPPVLPEVMAAFETAPQAAGGDETKGEDDGEDDGGDDGVDDGVEGLDLLAAAAAPELPRPRRALGRGRRALAPSPVDEDDAFPPLPDETVDDDVPDQVRRSVVPGDEIPREAVGNGVPDATVPVPDVSAARANARRRRRSPMAVALQREADT